MPDSAPRFRKRILAVAGLLVFAVVGGGTAVAFASTSYTARHHRNWQRPVKPSASTSPVNAPVDQPTAPSAAATATATATETAAASGAVQAILDQTNAWRRAAGVPLLRLDPGLMEAARKHNVRFVTGCRPDHKLDHQCPGEAGLGDRLRAEGVQWNAIAENIGMRGYFDNTPAEITKAGKWVNQDLYNEGPGGGHHDNLMRGAYTRIGIAVHRDSEGKVFVTEDFAN